MFAFFSFNAQKSTAPNPASTVTAARQRREAARFQAIQLGQMNYRVYAAAAGYAIVGLQTGWE
jgi:hypothetical protein